MKILMTVPVGPTRRTFESLLMRLPMQVREELKQQIESVTDPAGQEKIMLQALQASRKKHSAPMPPEELAGIT